MNITNIIWGIVMIVVLTILFAKITVAVIKWDPLKKPNIEPKKFEYQYDAKKHLMTTAEEGCFQRLNRIFDRKYYVVPQVHLSALFNHKKQGQNWRGAFAHINGKSVDFVLLDKITLRPICAIELDDSSHNTPDRQARDMEVEKIFMNSTLPLVRLKKIGDMTDRQILDYFKTTIANQKKNK